MSGVVGWLGRRGGGDKFVGVAGYGVWVVFVFGGQKGGDGVDLGV